MFSKNNYDIIITQIEYFSYGVEDFALYLPKGNLYTLIIIIIIIIIIIYKNLSLHEEF